MASRPRRFKTKSIAARKPRASLAATNVMRAAPALQRLNYFVGQMLSADDFRAEQEYFLARARRHNRYLHGWGVVDGLQIQSPSSEQIIVEPGYAIDCAGNEIHVSAPATLAAKLSATPQYVLLQYTESLTRPVPGLEMDATPTFSRVREGFRLSVVGVDPLRDYHAKVGTAGCGRAHAIAIARVTMVRGRRVAKLLNRRAARTV